MSGLARAAPQVPVVLASLVFWFSFAWGLPAEAAANEHEGDVLPEDPWAGVRISDAYDKLRCPNCWKYNELTAARCRSCGYEFPQPSGEYTYPPWVFVPGKGYYEEGTLLEPAETRKGVITTGYVLIGVGAAIAIAGAGFTHFVEEGLFKGFWAYWGGIGGACVAAAGGVFLVFGYGTRKDPIYASNRGGLYENEPRYTCGRWSPDSYGPGLKIEVTLLSF